MTLVAINHLALNVEESGRPNGRPLIFINSLGTNLRIWDGVTPHFEPQFRVVRYDKRGHGLSACPAPPYSIQELAADLARLMEALDINRAALVGISVGGMIAQALAAARPDKVSRLVLCDTAEKIGTADMWNQRIDTIRQHGMSSLAEPILDRWFAPTYAQANPSGYKFYYAMLAATPPAGYTGTCAAIRDADLTATAAAIQAPTLVLCGAEDRATTPAMARGLAAIIPNASYAEIAGAGHLPCVEQPEVTAVLISQFLQIREENGRSK